MQKRPTIYAKETYYICKRDLLCMQKRPTIDLLNGCIDDLISAYAGEL